MGGPYNIPRNYKGESKILFIFSTKAFLFTIGGAGIGILFYYILSMLGLKTIGLIFIVLLGLLGFAIGTFKIPDNANLSFCKSMGTASPTKLEMIMARHRDMPTQPEIAKL